MQTLRPTRRSLVLRTVAMFAVAAPLALATPAGAALPSTPSLISIPCPDYEWPGNQIAVHMWFTISEGRITKLAVDNQCRSHVVISDDRKWVVKAGTHFNWGTDRIAKYSAGRMDPGLYHFTEDECGDGPTIRKVIRRYNDVRKVEWHYEPC